MATLIFKKCELKDEHIDTDFKDIQINHFENGEEISKNINNIIYIDMGKCRFIKGGKDVCDGRYAADTDSYFIKVVLSEFI